MKKIAADRNYRMLKTARPYEQVGRDLAAASLLYSTYNKFPDRILGNQAERKRFIKNINDLILRLPALKTDLVEGLPPHWRR